MKTKAIVHHSESNSYRTTVSDIDTWHKERNFPISQQTGLYIGYQKCIDTDGRVYNTRGLYEIGCHCNDWDEATQMSYNKSSYGVCLLGDYEVEFPTKTMIESLVMVLKDLPNLKEIFGHCEVNTKGKVCPGKNIMKLFPEIKRRVFRKDTLWDVFVKFLMAIINSKGVKQWLKKLQLS